MSMTDSKEAEVGLLLLEASVSWCMSMPYSKKAESVLLLLEASMSWCVHVNDKLEEGRGRIAAPREGRGDTCQCRTRRR